MISSYLLIIHLEKQISEEDEQILKVRQTGISGTNKPRNSKNSQKLNIPIFKEEDEVRIMDTLPSKGTSRMNLVKMLHLIILQVELSLLKMMKINLIHQQDSIQIKKPTQMLYFSIIIYN